MEVFLTALDLRHMVPSRWSFFFHSASRTACSRFFRSASSTSTRGLSSSSEAVVVVSIEVEVSLRARGENEENENDRQAAKPDGVSPSSSVSALRPSRATSGLEGGAIPLMVHLNWKMIALLRLRGQ